MAQDYGDDKIYHINKIKEFNSMSSAVGRKKQYDSFLNTKKSIELPSNLLSLKKHSLDLESSNQHKTLQPINQARYIKNLPLSNQSYVEEKTDKQKNKSVLYKRLTNIRGENKQLKNLSFSKMLSRMVVMEEDEESQQANFYSIDQRIKHPSIVRAIEQKTFELKYDDLKPRPTTRSIEFEDSEKPSRKLFKRYYLPHSQATQTTYLQTVNPDDKYIYKNGKRVECKRIHNFYTSNMFRKGYDKFLRKTTEGFHRPSNRG